MNSYRIPEMAKQYMEHDMIQKHTDLPELPNYRARLLYEVLNKHSSLSGYSELYTLVTSLVQLGLDTHELVSVTNELKEQKAARSRQLKVLAGDYFSSCFYYLLSHEGQIELVGKLSGAVCEANRLKINFYSLMGQLKMTADDYLRQAVEVKSQVFLAFSSLLEDRLRTRWPELLRLLSRCEVLLGEIDRTESSQFRDSWGFWHVLQAGTKDERKLLQSAEADAGKLRPLWMKYKIAPQLYQQLSAGVKELQEAVAALEPDKLGKELAAIGEPFRRYLSAPRAMEEV